VPVGPLIAGRVVKNLALVLETDLEYVIDWITNATGWLASPCPCGAGSPAGQGKMLVAQLLTVCAPPSSRMFWSAPLVKLGGSFTAVAVIVNVCEALVSWPPLARRPLSL